MGERGGADGAGGAGDQKVRTPLTEEEKAARMQRRKKREAERRYQ
jgi:hypothetical protein